jgi:hypothetical protein
MAYREAVRAATGRDPASVTFWFLRLGLGREIE